MHWDRDETRCSVACKGRATPPSRRAGSRSTHPLSARPKSGGEFRYISERIRTVFERRLAKFAQVGPVYWERGPVRCRRPNASLRDETRVSSQEAGAFCKLCNAATEWRIGWSAEGPEPVEGFREELSHFSGRGDCGQHPQAPSALFHGEVLRTGGISGRNATFSRRPHEWSFPPSGGEMRPPHRDENPSSRLPGSHRPSGGGRTTKFRAFQRKATNASEFIPPYHDQISQPLLEKCFTFFFHNLFRPICARGTDMEITRAHHGFFLPVPDWPPSLRTNRFTGVGSGLWSPT